MSLPVHGVFLPFLLLAPSCVTPWSPDTDDTPISEWQFPPVAIYEAPSEKTARVPLKVQAPMTLIVRAQHDGWYQVALSYDMDDAVPNVRAGQLLGWVKELSVTPVRDGFCY